IALGKKVVPEVWDFVGEGVGFFKCGAEAGPAFVRFLERVIEESQGLNEYEDALHMLATSHHVGWVDVTGLRWTEIDFAEDLRRAQADVLPHGVPLDGARSPARPPRSRPPTTPSPPRSPSPTGPSLSAPSSQPSVPARARSTSPVRSGTPPSAPRWPPRSGHATPWSGSKTATSPSQDRSSCCRPPF